MIETDFESGTVYINGIEITGVSNIQWDKHSRFTGVFTKNLLSGKDSNNNLSAMIVKIEPNQEIGSHLHEGKAELHEVIYGEGSGFLDNNEINYKPGVISFIPGDTLHSVKAGNKGIVLLAIFTPPLN